MTSLDFLSYSRSTYVRYIRVTRLVWRQSTGHSRLEQLSKAGAGTGILGVTPVDGAGIYSSKRCWHKTNASSRWCFSRIWPSLLRSIMSHCTSVHSFFARLATDSPSACRMLCIFLSWTPGRPKCQLWCQREFLSGRNFSILWNFLITIFVKGPVCVSPTKSLCSVVFIENYQEGRRRGQDCKTVSCHWERRPSNNKTSSPKAYFSKQSYCNWWQWWSAEPDEAFSRNEACIIDFENSKAVKDRWERHRPNKMYKISRKYRTVKAWWQYPGIVSIQMYKFGALQRNSVKTPNFQLQAAPFVIQLRWGQKPHYSVCFTTDLYDGKKILCLWFLRHELRKILREDAWLCGTPAALVQKNAILTSVESIWDFSTAGMESCVSAGYFATREVEVEPRSYSVVEWFADACGICSMQHVLRKARGAPSLPWETLAKWYKIVNTSFTGEWAMPSNHAWDLMSRIVIVERKNWQPEQGQSDCTVHVNEEATILYMEEDDDWVWTGRRRAALDLWLGWLAAPLGPENGCKEPSRLP